MNMEPGDPDMIQRRWRVSLIWLVPAAAALIGASMLIQAWLSVGPDIFVTFRTAAGLEAGKTPVKFKDVTVGTVSGIALSEDGSRVVATISLDKRAENLARADTRFWVVRPRIGASGVSGVDTLFSGAYIGVDRGASSDTSRNFTGLEAPPAVPGDMPGKSFVLRTEELGSLDIGSPVYHRRVQVGRVTSYRLDEDGSCVRLQIFVDAPYDRFVTAGTRFWNASGVDVSLGADGIRLKTQSLAAIVSGGIAFATPEYAQGGPAAENAQYLLASDQATAMAPPDGPAQYVRLRFKQPLRGLSVGAPVLFWGVDLGKVVSITLDYDEAAHDFPTVVGVRLYPQRLGRVLEKLPAPDDDPQRRIASFLGAMVDRGLRAQARSANLLTGQLYISIEHVPGAPKVAFDESARPLTIPTVDGKLDRLQEQLANIVGRIDKIPFDAIGKHLDTALIDLRGALTRLNGTLGRIDEQLLPEAAKTLQRAQETLGAVEGVLSEDAPPLRDLSEALKEIQRAARSLRGLTDLLGRHPESLLRGRPDGRAPAIAPAEAPPAPPAVEQRQETSR
ncbi:MAG: MlaD family protein [Candidatus Accumulibacter sp.]|jgi:paraquat-inducible protein B|nr:MlaD family protein [Accumulibacter sp.]